MMSFAIPIYSGSSQFNLLTLKFTGSVQHAIRIIEQPQDQFVNLGETAIFVCNYTDSAQIPFWLINGEIYTAQGLPQRHFYRSKRLSVYNAMASDNGSTYQCIFIEISSRQAVLMVIPQG